MRFGRTFRSGVRVMLLGLFCIHKWELIDIRNSLGIYEYIYVCRKCGKIKKVER